MRRVVISVAIPIVALFMATLFMAKGAWAEFGDIILNEWSDKSGVRPVVFSHWFHRIRYKCKVCHGELDFEFRTGVSGITMAALSEGKFCAACHDSVTAWGLENCDLCHTGRRGLTSGVVDAPLPGVLEGYTDGPNVRKLPSQP